jgi:antirestriction protein ArdC
MKPDLYRTITDQIIAAIEAGVKAGGQPLWIGQGATNGLPRNLKTNKAYAGINVLILWLAAHTGRYGSSAWLTYKQAKELGGTVRTGERGAHIVYFEPLTREAIDPDTGESEERVIPMLRSYVVFNTDQIDGLSIPENSTRTSFADIATADAVLIHTGATIEEGGAQAYYRPSTDTITLPDRDRFTHAETFYAVALHELTHWSGGKSRLARDFSGRFGDEAYAFEELIAELGAAFTCADLGLIPATMPDHVSYIESWLKVLKHDKRAIFTAASQASKAHAFLMTRTVANELPKAA